jgi:surface carbohydrate biosynthesis protein
LNQFILRIKGLFGILRTNSFAWGKPRRAQIVIYPQGKSSDILLRYLDPAEVVVIDPWSTKLNIPALVLTLLRGGRKRIDYLQATIALIKPKFVITTTDNDMLFYRLKESLPNSITIAMQNGLRGNYSSIPNGGFFDEVQRRPHLCADYIVAFGTEIAKVYEQHIDTKVFVGGSLRNNSFISDSRIAPSIKSIVYVSQLPSAPALPNEVIAYLQEQPITYSEFYAAEKIVVEILRTYCIANNLEFTICGKQSSQLEVERKFFGDVSMSSRNTPLDSYSTLDAAHIVVTLDSTLGYEFHARGKRVLFIGGRFVHHQNESVRHMSSVTFGFPANLPKEGPYWLSDLSEAKIIECLNFLSQATDTEVRALNDEFKDRFMAFDPGNVRLIQFFASIGMPVRVLP